MLDRHNYQKVASVFSLIDPYFWLCVNNACKTSISSVFVKR